MRHSNDKSTLVHATQRYFSRSLAHQSGSGATFLPPHSCRRAMQRHAVTAGGVARRLHNNQLIDELCSLLLTGSHVHLYFITKRVIALIFGLLHTGRVGSTNCLRYISELPPTSTKLQTTGYRLYTNTANYKRLVQQLRYRLVSCILHCSCNLTNISGIARILGKLRCEFQYCTKYNQTPTMNSWQCAKMLSCLISSVQIITCTKTVDLHDV